MKYIISLFLISVCFVGRLSAVNLDFIEGGTISSDVTLNVPSDYATVQSALDALDNRSAKASVTITVKIADGTYYFSSALTLPRGVGPNLEIIGNVTSPSSVVLVFNNGTSGIAVTNGQTVKLINGLTLDGVNKAPDSAGIYSFNHGSVTTGTAIISKRFYYGVMAQLCSSIMCYGITVSDNIAGGSSNSHSTIWAYDVIATNNSSYGFFVNYSGLILAQNSIVTGSTTAYFAQNAGNVFH